MQKEIIHRKGHALYKITDSVGNTVTSNVSFERAEELLNEFVLQKSMSKSSALI